MGLVTVVLIVWRLVGNANNIEKKPNIYQTYDPLSIINLKRGTYPKKSDLIKRVSKVLKKKIKFNEKKISSDIRDYKVSGRKFLKTFGKMKYGRINPAIIEVYNSVKNGYYYNPYSKKHTAVSEK